MRRAVSICACLLWLLCAVERTQAQSAADAAAKVDAQLKSLTSTTGVERIAAINALGDLGADAAAVAPALAALLADADLETRVAAARALGAIGPGAAFAVEPLTALLADPSPRAKAYALYALGMIGEKAQSAFPKIAACLTDADPQVRREAVKAMRRLHMPLDVVAPVLLKLLEDSKTVEEILPVLHSMAEVGKEGLPRLIEAMKRPDCRFWVARILGEIGHDAAEAVPAVTEALSDERAEVRREAALCLGKIGAAAASAAPQLAKLVDDKDSGTRAAALWTLTMIGAPPAEIAGYAKAHLADEDEMVRMVAHWAATKADPQDGTQRATTVDLLLAAVKNKSPALRAVAAQGLVDLQTGDDPRVIEAFIEALSAGDGAVVDATAGALVERGEKAVPRLTKALENPKLRGFALMILGRIGPAAKDAAKPVAALASDEDPRVRAAALATLKSIAPEDPATVSLVVAALSDKDSHVRLVAVEMLELLGPAAASARSALEKLSEDPDPTVREAVKYVLGKKQ